MAMVFSMAAEVERGLISARTKDAGFVPTKVREATSRSA